MTAPILRAVGAHPNFMKLAPILRALEVRSMPALGPHRPACVVVGGDVNSTLACTAGGGEEAGAGGPCRGRTAQRRPAHARGAQPRPHRRVAYRLHTTERSAGTHLLREGVDVARIRFTGNVMIDSLLAARGKARSAAEMLRARGADPALIGGAAGYGVVTMHRPSNIDDRDTLASLLGVPGEVASRLLRIFALHPRTRSNIERFGPMERIDPRRIVLLPPRENTERPITIEQGTNLVVGRERRAILDAGEAILAGRGKRGRVPDLWDGHAADRIADDLGQWLGAKTD